jgi:type IV fimbrial biogenesis protein FimT
MRQGELIQNIRGGLKPGGFTLIELLVVVLIAAVLMGIAVPALESLVTSNQLTSVTDDFVTTLNLARSEAGRIGSTVTVSPIGSNWGQTGWRVASGGQTLRQGGPVPSGYSLNSNGPLEGGVTFDPTGRLSPIGTAGKFMVCQGGGPANGGAAKLITVLASGRVRIAQNDAQGNPIDDNGSTFTNCNP